MNKKVKIGNLLIILLFGIYPLIMTDGYFNITATKYVAFVFIFIVLLVTLIWQKLISSDTAGNENRKRTNWEKLNATDKWMLAFLLAQIVAFLFSKEKYISLTGKQDKNVGLITMVLFVLFYFMVKKVQIKERYLYAVALTVFDIIVIFSFLQFMGYDLFWLLSRIAKDIVNNFISTWGNTGVYGVYIVMMSALALGYYVTVDGKKGRIFSVLSCFLAYVAMLTSNTDATYLGVAFVTILIFVFLVRDRKSFKRYMECIVIFGYASTFFHYCYSMAQMRRPIAMLGRIGMSYTASIVMIFGGILLWIMAERCIKDREIIYKILSKVVLIALIAGSVLAILVVVWFSLFDKTTTLGFMEKYLRFNQDWGTERGYVWTWLINIYKEFSVQEKLTGVGQGMVKSLLFQNYEAEMIDGLGYYFDNAHNVYIHYLVTIGLFGVITYLGIVISAIRHYLKNGKSEFEKVIAVLLIACAIVDFFFILQPLTMPLLWFFFAMNNKGALDYNML